MTKILKLSDEINVKKLGKNERIRIKTQIREKRKMPNKHQINWKRTTKQIQLKTTFSADKGTAWNN